MADIKTELMGKFKNSKDTLWIFEGDKCVFTSEKDVLAPLVEYISGNGPSKSPLVILDKVMGNAAALLAIKAGAKNVYSPLGSDLAVQSLVKNQVEFHLEKRVPYILARNGVDICPMEKLSIDKTPDEFFEAVKAKFIKPGQPLADASC